MNFQLKKMRFLLFAKFFAKTVRNEVNLQMCSV